VLDRLLGRIALRVAEPAFHPGAAQSVLVGGDPFLALVRTPVDGGAGLVCVHEVSGRPGCFQAPLPAGLTTSGPLVDLVDGSEHPVGPGGRLDVALPAYGVRWLKPRERGGRVVADGA
jgi:hypothetical protein